MNTKKIVFNEEKTKKVILEKPKRKRKVTQKDGWKEAVQELENLDNVSMETLVEEQDNGLKKIILQQIKSKIHSYANQDKEKKLFCPDKFVNLSDVVSLLKECNFVCYYCKEETQLMYEYVREPKQWTLERLNNDFGHNNDNVVISCLSCNLRRRTMASERYVQTKQIAKIVKLDN